MTTFSVSPANYLDWRDQNHVFEPTLMRVGIGIVTVLALGQLISNLISNVKPTDPMTFLGVTVLLSGIALLACVVPAYRGSKVIPLVAGIAVRVRADI